MRGRLVLMLVTVLLTGCGNGAEQISTACFGGAQAMLAALEQAPGAVALEDGTPLSRCVGSARTDGDLQTLGIVLMRVADTLRADAPDDPTAAMRLGYLVGAVKAGSTRSSGAIAEQLARRVEQVATLPDEAGAAAAAALERGRAAGERAG